MDHRLRHKKDSRSLIFHIYCIKFHFLLLLIELFKSGHTLATVAYALLIAGVYAPAGTAIKGS